MLNARVGAWMGWLVVGVAVGLAGWGVAWGADAPVVAEGGAAAKTATSAPAEKEADPVEASMVWNSLSYTGQVQLPSGQVSYNIMLQGQMAITPGKAKVVGVSNEPILTEATDQAGQSILKCRPDIVRAMGGAVGVGGGAVPGVGGGRRHHSNFNMMQNGGMPQMPVMINLQGIMTKPTRIGSLKGYTVILVESKEEKKTIEAKAGPAWVNVVEGTDVKVESLDLQPNFANLQLSVRKPGGNPNMGFPGTATLPIIETVELVDGQGNAISPQYTNFNGYGNDNGKMVMRLQVNFQTGGPALPEVKTIRITVVTEAKEQEVPFELKDVPLP